MSGATSKVWLKYVPPSGYQIQERRDSFALYEIQVPDLDDWCVGMVERYLEKGKALKWRTLDHWKCDWKSGFLSREEAAQEFIANCPRAKERLETGRYLLRKRKESQQVTPEAEG